MTGTENEKFLPRAFNNSKIDFNLNLKISRSENQSTADGDDLKYISRDYLQVNLTELPSGAMMSCEVSSFMKSGGMTTSKYPI